jgi:formylglycine-generating enzyme required for sulfatase activity/energy-coupling factor transporter ATP-binding protein EcfA2
LDHTTFDQKNQHVENQINIAHGASEKSTDPLALKESYLYGLLHKLRYLPLDCIDPKAAQDASCKPLQLSSVYTALMTETPLFDLRKTPEGMSPEKTEKAARRLSALEMLIKEKHLVLLGDPGSGKSTFVNFVANCLAGELVGQGEADIQVLTAPLDQDNDDDQFQLTFDDDEDLPSPVEWNLGKLLPVRVILRDFAARGLASLQKTVTGDILWQFILDELGFTLKKSFGPHLETILFEEGGLILLDGLDEVPDAKERRLQVKQAVQGFADLFPKCRMLVTSRTYAYQKQAWQLEGFAQAVLSPFTSSQIKYFVHKWYENTADVRGLDAENAKGRATLLVETIGNNDRLAELAKRPILLTLMASLHAWRGGNLPEKREELYADAVELLLDRWERPKVVTGGKGETIVRQSSLGEWLKVDRDVMREALNRMAFDCHKDQPDLTGTADIREETLFRGLLKVTSNPDVNPLRLREYLCDRAGLIAARGEGVYTFPHRTFQEYLAACYLTDEEFPEELVALFKNDPQRWRESVLLAGAKSARGTKRAVWDLAEELCHMPPPENALQKYPDAEFLGAVLAGQVLYENDPNGIKKVSRRNEPKLERIRSWLLAIVNQGRLPVIERVAAGEILAVLGDDRDLEALVTIPAGVFGMGDDEDEDAAPCHEVYLPAYKIGRYPVTNGQYSRFVKVTGHEWYFKNQLRPENHSSPAVYVNWHSARKYCEWVTDLWRQEGRISADEIVHLPSEAQWEKAARGEDRRAYPWGNDWNARRCNTEESKIGKPNPVGIFPNGASPYGCLDMAGNVWEWTSSIWGQDGEKPDFKYPYKADDGREKLAADDKSLRVLRGGAWVSYRYYARCACRYGDLPNLRSDGYGFRVAVSPISSAI